MIVSTSLIRRRDDVSPSEFRRHWLDPHGPLTAKLPGVRRYDQNHVIDDAPGTNAPARLLRIDGFPILAFDSPESRLAAHTSPELKACDQDSRLFIGAVARVISDDGDGQGIGDDDRSVVKQILLAVRSFEGRAASAQNADGLRAVVAKLDGVLGVIHHRVIEQGAAPNSAVPFIGVEVEAQAELWIRDADAVAGNAVLLERIAPEIATFVVQVYEFI